MGRCHQFTAHLRKVNEICRAQGLNPMIWSDSKSKQRLARSNSDLSLDEIVLFCLPAKNNQLSGYYAMDSVVSAELVDSVPSGIDTVFWDYYHTISAPYEAKIKQHWQLAGRAPWMASGVWTWSRSVEVSQCESKLKDADAGPFAASGRRYRSPLRRSGRTCGRAKMLRPGSSSACSFFRD